MNKLSPKAVILPLALALVPAQAMAQSASGSADLSSGSGSASNPAPAPADTSSPILSLDDLNALSSGNQLAINNQLLNAENTGNTINGDYTAGDVNLADNALSGFNGLGNFVFNTGAQSSLQAGMSVTININD